MSAPFVMVVHPSFPARTVPELITYAKANQGKVNVASAGLGTGPQMAGALFKMMTGVDMIDVHSYAASEPPVTPHPPPDLRCERTSC